MNDMGATFLIVEAHRIVMRGDAVSETVVDLGIETVAALFRHVPPTSGEIERAIETIEDALMAARLAHARRGLLSTTSPELGSLPGLTGLGDALDLEQVENLFQRLAAAASGVSNVLGDLPADRKSAAALLILRETMHHLGFERMQRTLAD